MLLSQGKTAYWMHSYGKYLISLRKILTPFSEEPCPIISRTSASFIKTSLSLIYIRIWRRRARYAKRTVLALRCPDWLYVATARRPAPHRRRSRCTKHHHRPPITTGEQFSPPGSAAKQSRARQVSHYRPAPPPPPPRRASPAEGSHCSPSGRRRPPPRQHALIIRASSRARPSGRGVMAGGYQP